MARAKDRALSVASNERLEEFRLSRNPAQLPIWLSTDEVAEIICKSRSSVIDSINKGTIQARRYGATFRIHREEIFPPRTIAEEAPLHEVFVRLSTAMTKAGVEPQKSALVMAYYAELANEGR